MSVIEQFNHLIHSIMIMTFAATLTSCGGSGGTPPPTPPPVNQAPVFQSAQVSINALENSSDPVFLARATDPDGDTLTYSISGEDSALLTIDSATGDVSFLTPADRENPTDADADNFYSVVITASDGTDQALQTLTLRVIDVNDPPVFTSPQSVAVPENRKNAYLIQVTDQDTFLGNLAYEISGEDAALFTVEGIEQDNVFSGLVSFNSSPDFENPTDADQNNIYFITVSVNDATTTIEQNVTIVVRDETQLASVNLDSLNPDRGFFFKSSDLGLATDSANGLGDMISGLGDINGDGFDDFALAAPSAPSASGATNAGAVHVVFGSDRAFGSTSSGGKEADILALDGTQGFVIEGETLGQDLGVRVSSAGDFNGDGLNDIFVGSETDSYVIFGQTTGFGTNVSGRQILRVSTLDTDSGFVLKSDGTFGNDFNKLAALGYINNDGFDDIVVASPRTIVGAGLPAGGAYIIFGTDGTNGTVVAGRPTIDLAALTSAQGFIIGPISSNRNGTGRQVSSAGDVNGDDIDDLLITSLDCNNVSGCQVYGNAHIIFGNEAGFGTTVNGQNILELSSLTASQGVNIQGGSAEGFGVGAAEAGDINADGFGDIIVVAAYDYIPLRGGQRTVSEAYIIFGTGNGFSAPTNGQQILDVTRLSPSQGVKLENPAVFQNRVSSAGDINNDGFDDIILGTPTVNYSRPLNRGYVLLGRASLYGETIDGQQVLDMTTFSQDDGFQINGNDEFSEVGQAVSDAGDVNNDGFDDLLISAENEVFVIYGTTETPQVP